MTEPFYTYILKCADDSYYTGSTDDLEKRFTQHQNGQGCEWTNSRLPVTLVWSQQFDSRDEARQAEHQIKRWTRRKKEALIRADFDKLKKLAKRATPFHALRLALLAQDKRTSEFYPEEQAWPASRGAPARNLF